MRFTNKQPRHHFDPAAYARRLSLEVPTQELAGRVHAALAAAEPALATEVVYEGTGFNPKTMRYEMRVVSPDETIAEPAAETVAPAPLPAPAVQAADLAIRVA